MGGGKVPLPGVEPGTPLSATTERALPGGLATGLQEVLRTLGLGGFNVCPMAGGRAGGRAAAE